MGLLRDLAMIARYKLGGWRCDREGCDGPETAEEWRGRFSWACPRCGRVYRNPEIH